VSTYTLFGQDVADSHDLFTDNVEVLVALWNGKLVSRPLTARRAAIDDFVLQPAPVGPVPTWIGGGASESSLELAARLGLDLMLPSAFGNPAMFVPVVEAHRERFAAHGHTRQPRIGACWHVNVAETSQAARARWEPRYRAYFDLMKEIVGRVNPDPPPFIRKPFDFELLTTRGPALVGSPDEVVARLQDSAQMLQADTNLIYLDMGGQPADEFRAMVELIGSRVIPQLS
jgi:alkanesulfonate monooxygenase SsuD/methylene tetrahydromethanopterin reductase-like flavin-dependent oxidoreductase (luciferase family)